MSVMHGIVVSGKGEGRIFMKMPFYQRQLAAKLGFIPFEGTLNVKIDGFDRNKINNEFIEISGLGYLAGAKLYKAKINKDMKCAVVVPDKTTNPPDIIEVISKLNLREKYHLKDGSIVEVEII